PGWQTLLQPGGPRNRRERRCCAGRLAGIGRDRRCRYRGVKRRFRMDLSASRTCVGAIALDR
ncbi:hypothetical protein chiPu_0029722, partial [Chiloscyllium punctatum]|nr:hypothetical protein [Chiloscyllium punctatum]